MGILQHEGSHTTSKHTQACQALSGLLDTVQPISNFENCGLAALSQLPHLNSFVVVVVVVVVAVYYFGNSSVYRQHQAATGLGWVGFSYSAVDLLLPCYSVALPPCCPVALASREAWCDRLTVATDACYLPLAESDVDPYILWDCCMRYCFSNTRLRNCGDSGTAVQSVYRMGH